jgi:hypothetical protein
MVSNKCDDECIFKQRLEDIVKPGQKEFKINDLTNFEWKKVCINLPYSLETYQVDWSMSFYKSQESLDINKSIYLERKIVDLKSLHGKWKEHKYSYCYNKNAILKIERKENVFIILR